MIVVLTDDQTVAELTAETMPETIKAVADEGTGFSSSIVSSPLCCPSRAGFLSGQYPHNSGVFDNEPGYGGPDREGLDPAGLAAGRRLPHRVRRVASCSTTTASRRRAAL